MTVYLDNAATTKMSRTAVEEMLRYTDGVYGNPSSPHAMGRAARAALTEARRKMASLLGCEPRELIFTSGGSESDNQAILSATRLGEASGRRHIVSTAFEHPAVLNTLRRLASRGFEITLLDVHKNGVVTPRQVEEAIRPDTCLVSVMYANNEIGTLQPIAEIGALLRDRGVILHTDAVQAVGHLRIDVKEQGIDMLSLSAHKFHGPKGVGALYAKRGIALSRLIEGGAQERGLRAGTENLPAIMGMSAALCEACANMEENEKRMSRLSGRLVSGLSEIPRSHFNGDAEHRLAGIVNFSFEGIEGETLLALLDQRGVCASSGSACASGSPVPSHVLLAIGTGGELARSSIRFSLCAENTEREIEYTLAAVKDAVKYLRGGK